MVKKSFLNAKKSSSILGLAVTILSGHVVAGEIPSDGSLTLQRAVQIAIKNSPAIIMENIKVDLARADEQEAGDPFDPSFKASAALDRARGYQYPKELQQFPYDLQNASAAMANYNASIGLSPTLAPAIGTTPASAFMTDRQNNSEFKSSLTKLFRSGIYTDLSIILQSSASDRTQSDLLGVPALISNGIPGFLPARRPGALASDYAVAHPSLIQLTINFPILKFRGENNIAAANERYKIYLRESTEMTLRYSVASIIQNVVNTYWDYKAALVKAQYTRESEAQVTRWLGKLQQTGTSKKNDKTESRNLSGEIAHLSGFATQLRTDVSKADEVVNLARAALAQALGVSPDEARMIAQAKDDFPLDWSYELAHYDDAALRRKWNALAEQNRFDLKAASLQLDAANAIFLGAQNDVLPKLDLAFILKQQGLSVNDRNGPDLNSLRDGRGALGGTVQLSFEMKLDNSKAKAAVTRTRYLKMQKESEYGNAKRTVGLDVDSAVSTVRNSLVGLGAAKEQSVQYAKALDAEIKGDAVEPGRVFDLVTIEQARLKAFVGNVTAIQTVANAIAAAHFRTGKLLTQGNGVQEIVVNDLTKLP